MKVTSAPAESAGEKPLPALPQPYGHDRRLRVPLGFGNRANRQARKDGVRRQLSSDVASRKTPELKEAPHHRDPALREVALDCQALSFPDECYGGEAPFCMEVEPGRIGRRAETDVHGTDGLDIGVDNETIGRADLNRSKGKAIFKKGSTETDPGLVAERSGGTTRLPDGVRHVDVFDLCAGLRRWDGALAPRHRRRRGRQHA